MAWPLSTTTPGAWPGAASASSNGHPAGLGQTIGEVAHELVDQGEVKPLDGPVAPLGVGRHRQQHAPSASGCGFN